MPELPEVETVRRILTNTLVGKKILRVEVLYPRMILKGKDEFVQKLQNKTIERINRIGKYLIFEFSDNLALISHLRMEGKYLEFPLDEPSSKHARIVFYFKDCKVCYDDTRCFGTMELWPKDEYLKAPCLTKLGPEPFDVKDGDYLLKSFKNRRGEIKSSLLDQTIMTGLGNIYVDEVLYKSKISPYKRSDEITKKEADAIVKNAIAVLNKAIKLGGSTVSSYHPANGVDGKFQNELEAYGKKHQSCPNCGHIMRKDFIKGRGTTYCPTCQHVAIKVGITGKIASGKSSLLKIYQEMGYSTFSSDEAVTHLYKNDIKLKTKLVKLFGENVINDRGGIEKGYLKEMIISNAEKKKIVEELVHPLVGEMILKFIAKHRAEEIVFVEVPLLFEAKMERMFDLIIGVDASSITQKEHLGKRSKTVNSDLLLNNSNTFDKNAKKCNFLIANNGSLDNLKKEAKKIIKEIPFTK